MKVIKEFRVNEHLKLKLIAGQERNETLIFVDEEELMVCRFMLLQISKDNEIPLETINSIDEAEKYLSKFQERNPTTITDEEEFFGHCSNLQAWYEHKYNTRLLHKAVAFPLLKKLTEAGDSQAKNVFKEEIAKRLSSGVDSVVFYLLEEGYIEYLSTEQLESFILDVDKIHKKSLELNILKALKSPISNHQLKERLFNFLRIVNPVIVPSVEYVEYNGEKFFVNEGVLKIHITKDEIKNIETLTDIIGLEKLVNLKELHVNNQNIKKIEKLENLKELELLSLNNNQIEQITGLHNQIKLKKLFLEDNKITEIKGLKKLNSLECLYLNGNKIKNLTALECLKNLRKLIIYSNLIEEIAGIEELSKLEELNLNFNKLQKIENIEKLKKLKELHLNGNNIQESYFKKINWTNKKLGYINNTNIL